MKYIKSSEKRVMNALEKRKIKVREFRVPCDKAGTILNGNYKDPVLQILAQKQKGKGMHLSELQAEVTVTAVSLTVGAGQLCSRKTRRSE
jgi:hypothetical protein